MDQWIIGIVEQLGAVGVGLLMLLENVLPPIPSELIMPLAGYLASQDRISLAPAIGAGVCGAVVGACAWYWLALRVGRERLYAFADRNGRWLGIDREGLERATEWFEHRNRRVVFIGRLIPGLRTFISVPAGFAAMPFGRFLLYTIAGTAAWTTLLAYAGLLLGSQFPDIERYVGIVSWIVIGGAVLLYIRRIVRIRRSA